MRLRELGHSFSNAFRGVRSLYRGERNFRFELAAAVLALALTYWLRVDRGSAAAVILMCALVLMLEAVNTAFERLLDLLKPRLHVYAGEIKDMLAAAVLLAALGAVALGFIVFAPPLISAVRGWW